MNTNIHTHKHKRLRRRSLISQFLFLTVNACLMLLLSAYCISFNNTDNIIGSIEQKVDSVNYIAYIDSSKVESEKTAKSNNIYNKKQKVSNSGSITAYATYYHRGGSKTANGDVFRPYHNLTCAAHHKYPFGTKLRITNIETGKSVVVTVTDRGAYYKKKSRENDIDLTHFAFSKIAKHSTGRVKVKIERIG